MEEKNKALVEQMAQGDQGAFDEIYHSYSGKLYRMAYFITGNQSDSEDILQETLIKCYLHHRGLKQPEHLESWLYQILVRTAWRWEKKKKGKKELSFDGLLGQEEDARLAGRIQQDNGAGPLDQILENEASGRIYGVISRLDAKYRTVILLYYYNDFSIKEIARMTGTLEGTVKSRLHKARLLLREQLSGPEGPEAGKKDLETKKKSPEAKKKGLEARKKGGLCHG